MIAQQHVIAELADAVEALKNKPDYNLPKLRVRGRTSQSVYHSHSVDLEVVSE